MNEESVIHMRCEDVAAKLSALGEAGEAIRLVVAHTECEGDSAKEQEVIPEVMDVSRRSSCHSHSHIFTHTHTHTHTQSSGDELDEFEVELSKQGGGLGITIAGLVSEETGGQNSNNQYQHVNCNLVLMYINILT